MWFDPYIMTGASTTRVICGVAALSGAAPSEKPCTEVAMETAASDMMF